MCLISEACVRCFTVVDQVQAESSVAPLDAYRSVFYDDTTSLMQRHIATDLLDHEERGACAAAEFLRRAAAARELARKCSRDGNDSDDEQRLPPWAGVQCAMWSSAASQLQRRVADECTHCRNLVCDEVVPARPAGSSRIAPPRVKNGIHSDTFGNS